MRRSPGCPPGTSLLSLSLDFNHRMSVSGSQCESAVFVRVGNTKLMPAVHMVSSDDVSRYLVDGWIMVSTQCRTHIADRQTAGAFPLIPFERFHKWDIVPTVGQVSNARICVSNAASSSSGKAFPLLSARLMIPAQAFALKKNRGGTSPVSSVDDKEHTLASLGHTEELSVQHSPCRPPHQARVRPRLQGATGKPVRVQPTALRARSPRRSIPDQSLRKLGDIRA